MKNELMPQLAAQARTNALLSTILDILVEQQIINKEDSEVLAYKEEVQSKVESYLKNEIILINQDQDATKIEPPPIALPGSGF